MRPLEIMAGRVTLSTLPTSLNLSAVPPEHGRIMSCTSLGYVHVPTAIVECLLPEIRGRSVWKAIQYRCIARQNFGVATAFETRNTIFNYE